MMMSSWRPCGSSQYFDILFEIIRILGGHSESNPVDHPSTYDSERDDPAYWVFTDRINGQSITGRMRRQLIINPSEAESIVLGDQGRKPTELLIDEEEERAWLYGDEFTMRRQMLCFLMVIALHCGIARPNVLREGMEIFGYNLELQAIYAIRHSLCKEMQTRVKGFDLELKGGNTGCLGCRF